MSDSINFNRFAAKAEKYKDILPQLEALIKGEKNLIANMANVSSVLKEVFEWLWVGFYLSDENDLVLGPFQGPLACTRIAIGKGVCGTAFEKKETIIVPDVDKFPGHIACSSLSRSEIVVPGIRQGKVEFVLDVDSSEKEQFDETDQKFLESIVALLIKN
jgi:GAF domain-containing protein